jgi:ECF sigma factor/WD40-like Beta Propeller Repeat
VWLGSSPGEVTILLTRMKGGDEAALAELMPLAYKELRRLTGHFMREERVGHTLNPTALVHEAYLCLAGQDRANWQNRAQFMAVAAQIMRRILLQYARRRCAGKRLAPAPDGKYLIYDSAMPETERDLLYRERRPDGSLGGPVTFLKNPNEERGARFSLDSRFVAYVSDESGRSEVYVRDFPGGSKKWQISSEGGVSPRWRGPDGRELFYTHGLHLLAVPITLQPAFSPGAPVELFTRPTLQPQFDVSPDGKRFLIRERPSDVRPLSIHILHNWFEEFRGREQGH